MLFKPYSIQSRLLFAVATLSVSTLIIGSASWYWLTKTNNILEELHNTTLNEVNRSHDLTKQSALFTASAPYLLNLRSSYLVQSEGNKLLRSIDETINSWQSHHATNAYNAVDSSSILGTLTEMRELIDAFIRRSKDLSSHDDSTRLYAGKLVLLDQRLAEAISTGVSGKQEAAIRQAQLAVQKLVTASNVNSLLSLGEYQRAFLTLAQADNYKDSPIIVKDVMSEAHALAVGTDGLFQTRFKALQNFVSAHSLLGNISSKANELNIQVLNLIQSSELEIAKRRDETTENIKYAKILVALFGIGSIVLSLISAFYISGYIIKRLKTITTTMTGLAEGDLNIGITAAGNRNDELGALQKAFNVFHSNAIEHNKIHSELIQKTALFESTFNNINDGVAITSADGRLLAFNPILNILLSHFGSKSEAKIGTILSDRVSAVRAELQQKNQSHNYSNYKEIRNSLGHVLEIRTSGLPDGGSVWLFSDTTERRRVEERLQHFQRLESLGQLTGEVAHDVNNVLSAVKATLPSILSKRENLTEHRKAVERIEDAVDMGNSLTHRLLAFAKKQRLDPKYVELNDLVNGVSELISLSLGDEIRLKINNSPEPVFTYIDPLQLESSLLNLCMNSSHAINGAGEIRITIEQSDDGLCRIHVKDTGCGMSEETLKRAIEPFFSTRRGSRGTGLGLSIVYGFVKQSGGDMQLDSSVGHGTTVTLSLQPSSQSTADNSTNVESPSTSKKTVLIVEDDAIVLERAVGMFKLAGYDVSAANSYDEASRLFFGRAKFSLLFTDLYLGLEPSGWDLARMGLERNLVDKVVVTSGRLSDLSSPPGDLIAHCRTLGKPYDARGIANLV